MNNKSMSIAVVAAVAVMLIATSAVATNDAFAGGHKKKYEKNQATSQANACGNGKLPLNVGCQNTASQIQGDENAVSQAAEQAFGGGHDGGNGGGEW
jgi:hypothetical protein